MRRYLPCLLIALLLPACNIFSGNIPGKHSIVPKGGVNLLPNYSIAYADMVNVGLLVGAVYMITDPTAPTWAITETRLPDQRVLYALDKQYLSQGGDGEARYVVARRAEALAREQGLSGYRIERYEEAIDSRLWLPRRTAYAEVRLL